MGKKGYLIPLFNNSYGWVQKESVFLSLNLFWEAPHQKKKKKKDFSPHLYSIELLTNNKSVSKNIRTILGPPLLSTSFDQLRFWYTFTCQLILLFSLFLLLFIGLTALFSIIYESHYTISANFYLYLHYFQQKILSLRRISESSTDLILT